MVDEHGGRSKKLRLLGTVWRAGACSCSSLQNHVQVSRCPGTGNAPGGVTFGGWKWSTCPSRR